MSFKRLTLIATSFIIIGSAYAEQPLLDKGTARHIIEEYKTLRNECAQAMGSERKQCFAKLSASTKQYKFAKKSVDSLNNPKGSTHRNLTNLADVHSPLK
ncbi:MAG: hypothetical protein K6L80_08890 [Agarilytica sp.]